MFNIPWSGMCWELINLASDLLNSWLHTRINQNGSWSSIKTEKFIRSGAHNISFSVCLPNQNCLTIRLSLFPSFLWFIFSFLFTIISDKTETNSQERAACTLGQPLELQAYTDNNTVCNRKDKLPINAKFKKIISLN